MTSYFSDNPRDYVFIDVLRAIAALMVVVYHVIELGNWSDFPAAGPLLMFRVGWLGVDLFFVISGFVITHSALNSFSGNGQAFRLRFVRRRLARIVPLHLMTCLVFLFMVNPRLLVAPLHVLFVQIFGHIFFVHNLNLSTFGSINGVNWSVALEMQFYALMLFVVPMLARRGLSVILVFVPLAIAYRFLTTWIVVPGPDSDSHFQHVLVSQLPGTLDEFFFGIVLAMAAQGSSDFKKRFLAVGWRNFGIWVGGAAVAIMIAMALFWPRSHYWDNVYMISLWRTLVGLSFALVLAAAITFPGAEWLVFKPLRYLGQISYGIYLWHLSVVLTLVTIPGLTGSRLLFLVLLGTLLLAATTWHFFEKPIIDRFRS